ncbi:hypothetical protein [Actinocrispum wychmicini]|nr:hypothetical protein [Actinocrispum wychmicini]
MAALLLCAPAASAAPDPVDRCKVTDKNINELSGLASDGTRMYAINDGGTKLTVFVLDKNCKVEKTITNKTDPYDVEDLALAPDGTLWLEDAGDNNKNRETIALHALTKDGKATLYRLTYPDGAHDTEALLLDKKGVPYLVTKTPLGSAQVFRPDGNLTSPGPTKLVQVASVDFQTTETPGGPTKVPHAIDTVLVTGGAVSADGTVIALRTYTDAYLYSAPDGDVVAALKRQPVRVPLPNEPQGEAIAFEPDGTLLSASEGVGTPIRAIANATALVNPAADKAEDRGGTAAATEKSALPLWPIVGVGAAVIVGGFVLYRLLSRRRS